MTIEFTAGGKPTYRNRYPCTCATGYLDCAAFATLGLKCCEGCDHPERWLAQPAFTDEEIAHMKAAS